LPAPSPCHNQPCNSRGQKQLARWRIPSKRRSLSFNISLGEPGYNVLHSHFTVKAKFHYAIQLASRSQTSLGQIPSRYPGRSHTWSQAWFSTCRKQVRAISTCRDSSNLVADRFMPYSITLVCSLAGLRPARDLVADMLASWLQAG